MRQVIGDSLKANLSSSVGRVELWLAERRRDADRLTRDPIVCRAAEQLIVSSQNSFNWTADHAVLTEPLEAIENSLDPQNAIGWSLLDRDGQVIASTAKSLVGHRLPIPEDSMRRLREGMSTVCRPFLCPAIASMDDARVLSDRPLMAALSPIRTEGPWIGTMAIMIDPNGPFSELMTITQFGNSGETYAFDRGGTMISRSRFEHQLRASGALELDPDVSTVLRITIRDPGVDLTTSGKSMSAHAELPLTVMADQAVRGGSGTDVVGYDDYRGVRVVGAWTWLPEYEIAMATEMSVREAYAPVRLLSQLIYGLLTLSMITGGALITLSWLLRRTNRRRQSVMPTKRRIGQYELGESIGSGGMGTVYRGTHDRLKRTVAIKVLEGDALNSQSVARFEREAKMTAGLRHPNTIALYDFGRTDDGAFFYVMEHVEGLTLQRLVDRYGAQTPARVIHLLMQICGSLSEAHDLGLIHRDIKPANLMISNEPGMHDRIKVLDFGLVKNIERESVDMSLTSSDGITGTPMYMSPEMVRGAGMSDQRSDIYSVGGVGYTLLTGQPMFDGDASVEICLKQLREEPARPCDRIGKPLPDDLQNILMSCLRKDPSQRPNSIDDLAAALRQCDDAGKWEPVDALRWWSTVTDDVPSPDSDVKTEHDLELDRNQKADLRGAGGGIHLNRGVGPTATAH